MYGGLRDGKRFLCGSGVLCEVGCFGRRGGRLRNVRGVVRGFCRRGGCLRRGRVESERSRCGGLGDTKVFAAPSVGFGGGVLGEVIDFVCGEIESEGGLIVGGEQGVVVWILELKQETLFVEDLRRVQDQGLARSKGAAFEPSEGIFFGRGGGRFGDLWFGRGCGGGSFFEDNDGEIDTSTAWGGDLESDLSDIRGLESMFKLAASGKREVELFDLGHRIVGHPGDGVSCGALFFGDADLDAQVFAFVACTDVGQERATCAKAARDDLCGGYLERSLEEVGDRDSAANGEEKCALTGEIGVVVDVDFEAGVGFFEQSEDFLTEGSAAQTRAQAPVNFDAAAAHPLSGESLVEEDFARLFGDICPEDAGRALADRVVEGGQGELGDVKAAFAQDKDACVGIAHPFDERRRGANAFHGADHQAHFFALGFFVEVDAPVGRARPFGDAQMEGGGFGEAFVA